MGTGTSRSDSNSSDENMETNLLAGYTSPSAEGSLARVFSDSSTGSLSTVSTEGGTGGVLGDAILTVQIPRLEIQQPRKGKSNPFAVSECLCI